MKTKIVYESPYGQMLRRAARAAARFGLRKAGALLRASVPVVIQAAEKLESSSEHPDLKDPPRGFHV